MNKRVWSFGQLFFLRHDGIGGWILEWCWWCVANGDGITKFALLFGYQTTHCEADFVLPCGFVVMIGVAGFGVCTITQCPRIGVIITN